MTGALRVIPTTAIAHPVPESAVSAGTHRHLKIVALGKIQGTCYIGCACTAHNPRRTPIESPVEHQAQCFVLGAVRRDYLADNARTQLADRLRIQQGDVLFVRIEKSLRFINCLKRASVECGSKCCLLDKVPSGDRRAFQEEMFAFSGYRPLS